MEENTNTLPISVLLCTNRYDKFLEEAIDSILSQTFKKFELILVTNGINSENIKLKICNKFDDPRLNIYSTKINYLNFSLSLGIHFAKGEYVARMDSDDIAYPDRLEKQINFLRANPDVDILSGRIDFIDAEGIVRKEAKSRVINFKKSIFIKNPIVHPTVMFKRSLIESLGAYMGGIGAEDYDLWVRAFLDKDAKFEVMEDKLIFYRMETDANLMRGSRRAYAESAAVTLKGFLIQRKFKWIFGLIIFCIKSLFFSRKL